MKIYTDEEIANKLHRKSKIKKIIDFIVYPIVAILFICSMCIVLQIITQPEETPNLFGYKFFNVISGSMEPTLEIGDVVITKAVKDIKIDDIVTFRQKEGIVTHRVVNIIKENENVYYQTKGDNNNSNDDILVEYKDVEGICVLRVPKIGILIGNLQNTTFTIVIVLILFLIYKILQIKDDRKIARHEKRKELEKNK